MNDKTDDIDRTLIASGDFEHWTSEQLAVPVWPSPVSWLTENATCPS